MQTVLIRAFKTSDAAALAELFHRSVHAASLGYSPEQLSAWSPTVPDATMYLERAEVDSVFVAEDADGNPVGYAIVTATGYIDHLYCRPDMTGSGVGSALYVLIEETMLRAGVQALTVDSSEAAYHFFQCRGFSLQFRRDFALRDVPVHHYRMLKRLTTSRSLD